MEFNVDNFEFESPWHYDLKKKIKIEDQSDEIELLKKTDLATFNKCTKIKRGCDSTKISN